MKIGYVRVSTKDQNESRQEMLMQQLGVDKVYTEKKSGKDTNRPQLQEMMSFVRQGDVVVVESISRFARNTKDFLELMDKLNEKGVAFVSQKEAIDTSTNTGKFMMTVFAAIAELERSYILDRQAEGIAIAKAEGRYHGRKPKEIKDFEKWYDKVKAGDTSISHACKVLGIARSTWYAHAKAFEEGQTVDFG